MRTILEYWKAYGGFRAVFKSAYFWSSIFFTALIFSDTPIDEFDIYSVFRTAQQLAPGLLLFAGIIPAYLLSASERFLDAIRGSDLDDESCSPYVIAMASFTHFGFVQAVSLINSVLSEIFTALSPAWIVFSFWLFLYSLFLYIAALLAVFKLVIWFDKLPK